jgi:hypothetical protein
MDYKPFKQNFPTENCYEVEQTTKCESESKESANKIYSELKEAASKINSDKII